MMRLLIVLTKQNEAIPYSLLLLADETQEAIDKYIYESSFLCLYTKLNPIPIGVIALYQVSSTTLEIKNIAICNQNKIKRVRKTIDDFGLQYAKRIYQKS